ncbi:MAG TPA: SDR family oxidoreductase [Stellaceae bacterium]|nr:SDR family oxidoreductase [Stellaceae bacterium]
MSKPLDRQVAIVTGAASGIGLAIARRFAADGAQLMLADAAADALKRAASSLSESGASVITHAGDLADESVANAMIAATVERLGVPAILVNNAGGGVILPFLDHTPDTLKRTLDRNLWTVLWCCRAVLPAMRKAGYGRIVNIGADSVRNGLWDHAAYNAAKGGVHGLTTGLAREFAQDGITVNTVAPCAVRTPALDAVKMKNRVLHDKFTSVIPMGRPGEMDEVASMVAYLAGREAAFVTGQVISVNGGSTML